MRVVEILVSVSTPNLFCRLDTGEYRWLTDDLRVLESGPNSQWVERRRTAAAASLHGQPNIQPILAHDLMVNTANARLK
jgi:hypothetical protein